jgi:hypothetical protein
MDSIAKMKSSGERGQPCHSPLPMRKKEEDFPLTKMASVALTTHLMIHFIIEWIKPV